MMRKTFLVLLGVVAGVALTLFATQPRAILAGMSAKAAGTADTYRQLNLFGDVFERVPQPGSRPSCPPSAATSSCSRCYVSTR